MIFNVGNTQVAYMMLLFLICFGAWRILRRRVAVYTLDKKDRFIFIGYTIIKNSYEGREISIHRRLCEKAFLEIMYLDFPGYPKRLLTGMLRVNSPKGSFEILCEETMEVNLHFIR